MNFISDNAFCAAPEMLDALRAANEGTAASYGEDAWTKRLEVEMAHVFEHSVSVYPVLTGTAANALALSALAPPHGAIFCHSDAHVATDECGAPEFFSRGAKLVTIGGESGKLEPESIERELARFERGSVHHSQPAVITITQASEFGTSWRPEEIKAIAAVARRHDLKLHMDGARLANAIAFLDCAPAETTWRAGVDVLSFGATKNGALAAEAVIFFEQRDALEFGYRHKQSGQLVSKTRFISAQLLCALEESRWLGWAAHANALARRLAERLHQVEGAEIAYAVEANLVFAWMTCPLIERLRAGGATFYEWPTGDRKRRLIRFAVSFATPEEDIERLAALLSG